MSSNVSLDRSARNGATDRPPFDPELCDRITKAIREHHHGILEGRKWRFRCWNPVHANGDQHPSHEWDPAKGVHHCHVCGDGGGAVALADRLGVNRNTQHFSDQRRGKWSAPPPSTPSTVEEFAQARGIALETFKQFGVTLDTSGPRRALRYPTTLGIDRLKCLDRKRPKYRWTSTGGSAHGYGLHEAACAILGRLGGPLYLVNGEPSVWACASRDVAAFCLCAGERTRIPKELIECLRTALPDVAIRVVYDADTVG